METVRERIENMPLKEWRILDTIRDYYEIEIEEALERYDNFDDFSIIHSTSYNEYDVYEEWMEEAGLLYNVPKEFRNYLDFEAMYRDFTFNGGEIINVGGDVYIIFFS